MRMRFFDFEVTPNWWLCVFGDYPETSIDLLLNQTSIKRTFVSINSDMPDARERLLNLLREDNFVQSGYNIKGYDLIIANAIYQGFTPQQVKIISDIIINPAAAYSSKEHLRLQSFAKRRISGLTYQDLMDDNEGSLKEKEAILGLDILESNVPFDKEDLTEDDKIDLDKYCRQDVFAAMYFYDKLVKSYIETKLAVGKKFNIPERECYMCTNANLVSKVLKATKSTFGDEELTEIFLPSKIKEYCYENLPPKVVDKLRTCVSSFTEQLYNNTVSFGDGGIHSVYCNSLYVESDDEWILVNLDAESYYPSMMLEFLCLSRSVPNSQMLRDILLERLALKNKPNLTPEEDITQTALKLILNTCYGASGNKYLALYDPYMRSRCCRLGQIFLAALANKLVKSVPGLQVIQTNTDGILAYFRRKDLDKVRLYTKEWTAISGINIEEDFVSKIWQRDVNNYLLVKANGKVKNKGLWLLDTWKKKGVKVGPLTAFVSQKAVQQYLLNGKDIVQSVVQNTNLEDFVMTCKKGPTYRGVIQRLADGTEVPLFKCNRVIATTDESVGKIYKYKMLKGNISYTQMSNIPEHCLLLNNELNSYSFIDLKPTIDYMFYIERCADLLDMQWKQLSGTKLDYTTKFNYFD